MKKEINKILIVLGFIVALVGLCVSVAYNGGLLLGLYFRPLVFAIIGVTCVFATNALIKNIAYVLNAVLVIDAINILFTCTDIGLLVYSIGLFIMTLGALIYFFILFLAFCGFVKKGKKASNSVSGSSLLDELIRYKEMQQEKVLTEEEFSDIKQKIFDSCDNKIGSIDDLKKWKKLLDQQVITEEEFSKIKADIFCK